MLPSLAVEGPATVATAPAMRGLPHATVAEAQLTMVHSAHEARAPPTRIIRAHVASAATYTRLVMGWVIDGESLASAPTAHPHPCWGEWRSWVVASLWLVG